MKYDAYLRTEQWRRTREKKLSSVGGMCEGCSINRASQVHHRHYRSVGHEKMGDLEAVCPPCHVERHPGKFELDPLFDDHDCPMCPSERAQVFIGDRSIFLVCTECGYDSSTLRKRTRKPKKRRRRQRRPCPICGKMIAGMRQHTKAKHSKITIEELEAPRREAERDKVLAMVP